MALKPYDGEYDPIDPEKGPSHIDAGRPTSGRVRPFSGEFDPLPKKPGVLGTLKEGAKSTGRALASAADSYSPGDGQSVVDRARAQREAPKAEKLDEFYSDIESGRGEDDGLGDALRNVGGAAVRNPGGAGLAVVEQLPNAAPALAGGWLGWKAGAAGGAALGSVVPVVGTGAGGVIGGVLGGLAGMFLGNAAIETGHRAMEMANDGDFTPEEASQARSEGAIKGGVITGVDAITLGVGRLVSSGLQRTVTGAMEGATRRTLVERGIDIADEAAVARAVANPEIAAAVRTAQLAAIKTTDSLRKRVGEGATLLAMESAGEGVGEYLGELAATGEADITDAVLESVLSLGQSGIEAAWNARRARALNQVQPLPTEDNPNPAPVDRPDPAAGALSRAAAQLPSPDPVLGLPAPDPVMYGGSDGVVQDIGPNVNVDGIVQPTPQARPAEIAGDRTMVGMEGQAPVGIQPNAIPAEEQRRIDRLARPQIEQERADLIAAAHVNDVNRKIAEAMAERQALGEPEPRYPVPKGLELADKEGHGRWQVDMYRESVQALINQLTKGGDVAYVRDANDRIVSRTPSVNPSWWQDMDASVKPGSVEQAKRIVSKALVGGNLGPKQARFIRAMMDLTDDMRVDPQQAEQNRATLAALELAASGEAARNQQDYEQGAERSRDVSEQDDAELHAYLTGQAEPFRLSDLTPADYDAVYAEVIALDDTAEQAAEAAAIGDTETDFQGVVYGNNQGAGQAGSEVPAQQGLPGRGREAGQDGSAVPAGDAGFLESYTEQDLAERARQQKEAEDAAAQAARRDRADADRDGFALTGSDRDADVGAAAGQNDLLQTFLTPPTDQGRQDTRQEADTPVAVAQSDIAHLDYRIGVLRRAIEDVEGRDYRANNATVTVGDPDSLGGEFADTRTLSIGEINERRRKRGVQQLRDDIRAIERLKQRIERGETTLAEHAQALRDQGLAATAWDFDPRSAEMVVTTQGVPYKTERAAMMGRNRQDLKGRQWEAIQVDGGWALRPVESAGQPSDPSTPAEQKQRRAAAAGPGLLYRLNSNRRGITKQELDGIVSLMARPGIDIVSVQSAKDLPPEVQQTIAGYESRAEGFLLNGTAYLIADNLATPQRAVAVMIHEVVGHHGVRALFGDQAAEAYASIYRAIPADVKLLLREKYKDQLRSLDHAGRVDLIADEFMAALSEHQITLPTMRRVVAIVRSALRRIFGREFVGRMTTGDILYILERAGKLKGLSGPIVSAPNSPRFSFLGRNSVNANQNALAVAREMHKNGKSLEEIRKATGWHRGPDRKWRYEISDRGMRFKQPVQIMGQTGTPLTAESLNYMRADDGRYVIEITPDQVESDSSFLGNSNIVVTLDEASLRQFIPEAADAIIRGDGDPSTFYGEASTRLDTPVAIRSQYATTLGEVLDHPALFDAYPQLANVSVVVDRTLGAGGYMKNIGGSAYEIGIGSREQAKTLIHEVQHVIQAIEGFAPGGSPQWYVNSVYPEMKQALQATTDRRNDAIAQRDTWAAMVANNLTDAGKRALLANSDFAEIADGWGVVDSSGVINDRKLGIALRELPDAIPDRSSLPEIGGAELNSIIGMLYDSARTAQSLTDDMERQIRKVRFLDTSDAGNEGYMHLYGEMEARNTEARLRLNDEQRRDTSLDGTMDRGVQDAVVVLPGPDPHTKSKVLFSLRDEAPAPDQAQQFEGLRLSLKNAGANVRDTLAVDQLISSDRIPTLTISDLEGMTIFPTIADRTAAAAIYTGIDSSQLQVAIPLLGGPNFPLRESNAESGIVWANRGRAVTGQKAARLKAGASHMMIVMGDANMHQSNTTVSNAFFATLSAYVRDQRITKKNAEQLTRMVRQSRTADPQVNAHMMRFPGLTDQAKLDAYLHRISFASRRRLLDLLGTKGAQALGAPSMTKILDATREPSLAGQRWGDGVLVVEVDQVSPMVNLGEEGTQPHPDFPLGIRGKVTGRLEAPVNYEILWQDWIESARENAISRGTPESRVNVRRAFELAKPAVTITPDLIARIGSIKQSNIDGPRQARLAADFAAGNWKTSDQPVNRGGVSPQEFADAIQNSDAYATLTPYTAKELKAGIKAGTMRLFQLGQDGQIFFMLETRPDGRVELASVVNNEQGARGIGAPAVLLKAIEEGATHLTAFAVANDKYPAGFLPTLYESFGFEVTNSMEFDARYFRDDLPKRERDRVLQDAVKYWTDSTPGFNPDSGMPSVVEMAWRGTDADRENITERYFRGGLESLLAGRVDADAQASTEQFDAPDQQATQEAGSATDAGRAAGAQGAGNRPPVPSRAQRVVAGIAELNDTELRNLGLTTADRDAARAATRSAGARFSLRGREQAGDRGGRGASRSLAPLPDAPSVPGFSGPDPRLVDVAEQYARANGIDLRRQSEYVDVDPARAARIADAYEAMPHAPQDPVVREAYENLIQQTRAQYDALVAAGYRFWFVDPSSPEGAAYLASPWNAMRDIRENQSMGSYPTDDGFGSGDFNPEANPLLADTGIQWPVGSPDGQEMKPVLANDLFRVVHDAFGHGLEGAGFRARGEENAWQAHVRLFTGSAVGAITSETRGQNSWLNYGPHGERNRTARVEDTIFADQKTGLMPEWTWTEGRAGDMPAEPRFSLAPPVDSPAFKRWFGDSKIVDAQGRPLVMYHGTQTDIAYAAQEGRPIYVTDSPRYAGYYASGERTGSPLTFDNEYPLGDMTPAEQRGRLNDIERRIQQSQSLVSENDMEFWSEHRNDPVASLWPTLDAEARARIEKQSPEAAVTAKRVADIQSRLDQSSTDTAQALSDYRETARRSRVAAPNIAPVYVAIQNPYYVEGEMGIFGLAEDEAKIKRLMREGYDGAIWINPGVENLGDAANLPYASEVLAFRPEQIKSAVGNRGTFDPTNPDIRYSLAPPIESAAFKRWFGDSKVVDENGEPRIMYHGTLSDFSEFRNLRGIHFTTPDAGFAERFTTESDGSFAEGAQVLPVYVRAENPFDYENKSHVDAVAVRAGLTRSAINEVRNGKWQRIEDRTIIETIKRLGFDGVYVDEDGVKNLAVFRPEQIKSAVGNRGTFDPTNPDIRYSIAPPIESAAFKRWFGDSKVVDENGAPLRVYHGGFTDITQFDTTGRNAYFAATPGLANTYSMGAIDAVTTPVYISMKNPMVVDYEGREWFGNHEYIEQARAEGYDGVIFLNIDDVGNYRGDDPIAEFEPTTVYVPFSAEQIKSAIGNNGNFDPANPDIRFSLAPAIDSSAFKRWFGDSKVVDADGKPLVVYHGTKGDFAEFQLGRADRRDGGWFGDGFYLTASQDLASSYAMRERDHSLTDRPANVMPVYVRMSNPYRINLAELSYDEGSNFTKKYGGNEGFRKWLADNGYDGVIGYRDPEIAGQGAEFWEVVVFDPTQIKSAIGNRGTFDPSNPDIRYSLSGQTQTPAFKRWFGDSKVVDAQGKPLVVYHGTGSDFSAFSDEFFGDSTGIGDLGEGFYFTNRPEVASSFAEDAYGYTPNVMPVYLSLQNPATNEVMMSDRVMDALQDDMGFESVRDILMDMGYDGIIWDHKNEGGIEYVAFRPEQIKSAVGNRGTFDPSNPDIRYSLAPPIESAAFKRWFGRSLVTDDDGNPQVMYHASYNDFTEFNRMWSASVRRQSMDTVGSWFTDNPGEGGAEQYANGEGAIVYPVYLSIQRPKIYDRFDDFLRDMHEANGDRLEDMNPRGVGSPEALRERLKLQGYDGIAFTRTETQELIDEVGRRQAAIDRAYDEYRAAMREAEQRGAELDMAEARQRQAEIDRLTERLRDAQRELGEAGRSTEFDNQYVWVAFDPTQIKSAIGNVGAYGQRPVTADEAARFGMTQDEANEAQAKGDIRFSLKPTDKAYADAVEAGDMQAAQEMVIAAAEASGVPVFKEEGVTAYTVRRGKAPRRTQKAYKLFRVKRNSPGELFALFVGANDPLPQGVWLDAVAGEESSPSKTGKRKVKSKLGDLAYRPGWHAGDIPLATHIGAKNQDGQVFARKDDEVWAEVEMAYDVDYQPQADANGRTKSGAFSPALADIKEMPVDGMYRYKTNPAMTGSWIISGSMRINRVLSEQEVNEILAEAGHEAMPWAGQEKGSRQWKTQPLDLGRWGLGTNPARNQKKLLDPVTYDDAGNVIPLSKRFDQGSSDPRFSLAPPTESAAFKRWFGDSKVVDAEGRPLVVYHGGRGEISSFDRPTFFSNLKEYAETYEKGAVYEAFLSLHNPLEVDANGAPFDEIEFGDGLVAADDLIAVAMERGHDGLIVRNVYESSIDQYGEEFVAFRPEQIKSASGNRGTFDPSNPDIRYSRTSRAADAVLNRVLRTKATTTADAFNDLSPIQKSLLRKVGTPPTVVQASDWLKARMERAGTRIRQGIVDRYASLKELDEKVHGKDFIENAIHSSSWVLARMSSAASGAMQAMMSTGRLAFDAQEKVITLRDGRDTGGLTGVLAQLGSPAEVERWFAWVAANRADKLMAEGRENLFTADEIREGKTLNTGRTAAGKSRPMLYGKVFREFQQYRDDVLAIAEKTGIISAENRAMWRDEFYVPFYRVMEEEDSVGPRTGKGLSRQEAFKKLKGGKQNLNDLLENTLMNFHHLLSASLKNQAATQVMENALAAGIARRVPESRRDRKTSTFILKGGRKVFYQVDDGLVFEALTALADPGLNNLAVRTLSAFKRVFTNMTTVTPQFIIANTMRDLMQAAATSPTSKNVIANLVQGAHGYRDATTRAEMQASGGAFSFGHLYGADVNEVKASLQRTVRGAQLVTDPAMVPKLLTAAWRKWGDMADTAENVSRTAVYQQNVRQHGRLRAAYEARDVMDFSQHGAFPAVRFLIRVVPFLNARLQGLDKLYRSGAKPALLTAMGKGTASDKQAAMRFGVVTGALTLASIALYLANADDDEFRKLEDWQKDAYWPIRIGDSFIFIPKPFEVGAIATMAERLTEQMVDDKATGKLFAARMKDMMMQTFSFSPVPQAFQPVLDVYSNKDAFTGRQIESMGMERLSKGLRSRDSTTAAGHAVSAVSRVFGDDSLVALSPVQADHLIRGYLGAVGANAAGIIDTLWRSANGEETPDKRWSERQPFRRFYRDLDLPVSHNRYSTLFYEGLREAGRVYADVKELQELGRMADARELQQDKRNILALRRTLNQQQRRISAINKRMEAVRRSDRDGAWKRRELDRLTLMRSQIMERVGKRVESARASS